ncbi:MAG: porin [Gammaproteobacteria bacterium]|nr:porin [Gammaproteobacteria bacterium]
MKPIFLASLCAGLLVHVAAAHAESDDASAPTIGEILDASGVTLTGYVDTSFTYLSGAGGFTSDVPNRVFDRERKSFNLHLVDVTASYLPEDGFGGLVQLSAGSDANVFAPLGTGADDEFDVQEAFAQYATGPFTFVGGKFVTLAGAEVIESPANLNFSRSILFGYAIPFTHTGVRASMETAGGAKFTVGVNNGWDVLKESAAVAADGDVADEKTLELGASFSPTDFINVSAAAYTGNEPGAVVGRRDLVDVVVSYLFSDSLIFVVNGDWAQQEDAVAAGSDAEWKGVAGYANYQFAEQWRAVLRGEWFDDEDGFRTGVAQEWKEVTATLAYLPIDAVEIRAETRYDWSDIDSFVDTDGSVDDSQYSVGLEAIYKF